jgi:hypothetical protein
MITWAVTDTSSFFAAFIFNLLMNYSGRNVRLKIVNAQ